MIKAPNNFGAFIIFSYATFTPFTSVSISWEILTDIIILIWIEFRLSFLV